MTKPPAKPSKPPAALPADYAPLLAEIKARVKSARVKAGLAANRELLALYWDIGRLISDAQRNKGYGRQVVERLAMDVQREFPGLAGFSPLNVWRMRAFFRAHTEDGEILSQPVTESVTCVAPAWRKPLAGPPEPFASLPWGHNLVLLHKLEAGADRLWYAAKAVEHGWSRSVLALQIDAGLHTREGKAVTNFKSTLPPAQSDLAQSITKDPYLFDFLTLRDDANERAVEEALVVQVEKGLTWE